MKRKLGFLIGLVGIGVLVFGGLKLVAGRSPKQGVLKVNSAPVASVFLDNKHIGRTPIEEKVDTGEHTIKLVPESTIEALSSWEGSAKVTPNVLTYVNANLAESEFTTAVDVLWLEKIVSKNSELSVTSNPDGATVSVDGETKGVAPLSLTNMSISDHTLSLSSPGFLARTLKIKTSAGYKLIASVKLALSAPSVPEATPSPAATSPTPKVKVTPTKSTSAVPDPPRPFILVKDTPTGFLRVRTEPAVSASEAARINPGEKYTILDEQKGWFQIKYNGTNTGWVSGQYAEKVE